MYRTLRGPKGHGKSRGLYFVLWKGNENNQLGTGFSVHHRILSAVTRVEFVIDRVLCIVLRVCWCDSIVLNVHATSEEKMIIKNTNSMRNLEQVFFHLPKYHMKIMLVDLNAKVGRENILKPTIGNDILHQIVLIMVLK